MKQFSHSFLFVPLQLDPQTVQSKNWHMDVIEMNGVLIYFSLNILILLHYCLTQSFLWLMCDLSHYLIPFQIKVEFSMKFTSRDLSLKRTPSKKQSGVFGVKISVVTKWVKYQALKEHSTFFENRKCSVEKWKWKWRKWRNDITCSFNLADVLVWGAARTRTDKDYRNTFSLAVFRSFIKVNIVQP